MQLTHRGVTIFFLFTLIYTLIFDLHLFINQRDTDNTLYYNTTIIGIAEADEINANNNGIQEPVLSKLMERDIRVPHTKQVINGRLANLIGLKTEDALGAKSILGHEITMVSDPHDDLFSALRRLSDSAMKGVISKDDAREILDILLGATQGRIYDGFSLLNFNRWNDPTIPESAFPKDVVKGEYKTKLIHHSGERERNFKKPAEGVNPDLINNKEDDVNIWEVDVNMFWYGQQFDSDTFYIRVPVINAANNIPSPDDTIRINYHIYSLIDEDFAPIQMIMDADPGVEFPGAGSVSLPHKGEDTVWVPISKNTINHVSVQHTALRFLKGIYTWGWRVHPPRVQFLNFLFELTNAHTERKELNPAGQSMAIRNKELDINGIGDAAPEKKIYKVARAALEGTATPSELFAMLNNPDIEPRGTFRDWIDLMVNQLQLPPEAMDILASEGKDVNSYDYIVTFLNNEMYGTGPFGEVIRDWRQGDTIHNRIFNLDNHTHYYKSVDFGPALNEDLTRNVSNGVFSFEIMNFKPTYGEPKAAEVGWRTGWGFRPGYSVIQQGDVFPRESDQKLLKPFASPMFSINQQQIHYGYQYSAENRQGDFVFNPPLHIIQSKEDRAFDHLCEFSFPFNPEALNLIVKHWKWFKKRHPEAIHNGLIIGQKTEGFGIAKMCKHDKHIGNYCSQDLSQFHPMNIRNVDINRDGINDVLYFPTFLINPDKDGGDVIPPTMEWGPFLFLSPDNGTIYIDPERPEKGYWVDLTYAHGIPIQALNNIEVNIEMPRAKGQLFYQFDDLFHDNDIFSPHPISSQR